VLAGLGIGARPRAAGIGLGLVAHPARVRLGALLDLAGAALGGLDDRPDLLGGGPGHAGVRRPLRLAAQVLYRVRDLAEMRIHLIGVVSAAGGREVFSGDVSAIKLHGREAYSAIGR
jgi:hypothetical protein